MSSSIFGIGVSGLAAAQAGLTTTSHNIANANTPGYSRQTVVQATQVPQFDGAGFMGRGTNIADVQRSYSALLEAQMRQQQAQASQSDTYLDAIRRLDNLLGDGAVSLSPAIDDFFRSVDQVAARPADTAARQGMIASGNALAARFRTLDGELEAQRGDVNRALESSASRATSLASQIASLNGSILAARGSTGGIADPNDLLDQRDALVRELAKIVRVTVVPQDDGAYNVFAGTGQPLVVGNRANALVAYPDPADPRNTAFGVRVGNVTLQVSPDALGGGEVAGLLAFRADALEPTRNALGRIALVLAQGFNDQQRLGQDLDALAGSAFFAIGAPDVMPNANNTGSAALSATIASSADYGRLETSDYRVAFDGSAWSVTRLADGVVQGFASLPQTIDGVTLAATGAPAAGDSFLVLPTRLGARDAAVLVNDPRRIAAASPVVAAAVAGNAGAARIAAPVVSAPPPADPDLRQPVTLTFTSATAFDVSGAGTGNPTGVSYTPGAAIGYNGWTTRIEGLPQAGDRFTIKPNVAGVGNNGNARLLAGLQTENLVAGGTTTLQGAYAELVAQVGNKTRELQVTGEARAKLLAETSAAREALSGVNLDEEAANLLRYQQAYQAAAKVIDIAGTLFAAVLAIRN